MKIRGIGFKNPIAYIEHVTVPLLIMSSNISDDIAKAAETRCICKSRRENSLYAHKLEAY